MELVFLIIAFALGLGIKLLGFPPLIGFLLAGFTLNYLGYESNQTLESLANLGITLMLFTIGLKLNLRDLYKREVWLGSTLHCLTWVGISTACFLLLVILQLGFFAHLDFTSAALIAFALSFSSTVCVVKVLEESGEMKTRHGKVIIGILVMQDIFAVVFLVIATGKTPSIWALGLVGLFMLRPLFDRILDRAGHGELLPLVGFLIALGGYELFSLVGIKGDLGALIVGMLLANHGKATELSKALMGFKDLFLIGFFLSIGFIALPTVEMLLTAMLICALLPLKFSLFFAIFSKLRLRARTSYLSSLVLGNYSEFGLIVMSLLVGLGVLDKHWLVILALSVSISFVITSILYRNSHNQYRTYKHKIKRYEHPVRLKQDCYIQPTNAEVLILGMGRVGKGAYVSINEMIGDKVWGMDADPVRVSNLNDLGMQVLTGDGEDIDFWENTNLKSIKLIMLAVPATDDISNVTEQLRCAGYKGKIAAVARYEDEIEPLLEAGIDKVFNFFTEAGTGFAEESLQMIEYSK